EALAEGFTGFLKLAGMPTNLSTAVAGGINDGMLQTLANEATQQWTATFNPRTMDAEAFQQVYRNAL
ncbi:MAG: alcohol dehydrogenase, partial [Fuerstiella sp.]